MIPLRRLALLATMFANPASAAEVSSCFTMDDSATCNADVLSHVEFKGVVTEFLDPEATTAGHTVGRLIWREVLEAVSDVRGAGVVFAHDEGDTLRAALEGNDPRSLLATGYHDAAIRVAETLSAQLAIWGIVLEDRDGIYIEPAISMLGLDRNPWTALRLTSARASEAQVRVNLTGTRLAFAPQITSRAELFQRDWVTRCRLSAGCPEGVEVREAPQNESRVIGHVPVGASVRGIDLRDQWAEVELADGRRAFANLYHLELFPKTVRLPAPARLRVRADPTTRPASNVMVDAPAGEYAILEARRTADQTPWFQIEVGAVRTWVNRSQVIAQYNFPFVHFVAGLYRYGRSDLAGAAREFQAFLDRAGDEENATRATALKFLAASQIANAPAALRTERQPAIQRLLEEATSLTPYDSSIYMLRALVALSDTTSVPRAFEDLERAAQLAPNDQGVRTLIDGLNRLSSRDQVSLLLPREDPSRIVGQIERLETLLDGDVLTTVPQ